MDLTNITKHNIARVRKRLAVETNKLGSYFTIKRKLYEEDGLNGFTVSGEKEVVSNKKMIFIVSTSANQIIVEGGRKVTVSAKLIFPYEDGIDIIMGDYLVKDDRTYYVVDCVNVDGLNAYYSVSLTGNLKELNGYG